MENTWNLKSELQEKYVHALERGWGRVTYTFIYCFLRVAIVLKYGKYFLP